MMIDADVEGAVAELERHIRRVERRLGRPSDASAGHIRARRHLWLRLAATHDRTARLLRALVAACAAEGGGDRWR
jgi:hypothetical protein